MENSCERLENKLSMYFGELNDNKISTCMGCVDILYANMLGIGKEPPENLEKYSSSLESLILPYKVKVYCELKRQGRVKEARYFWQEFIVIPGNKQTMSQESLSNRKEIPKDFKLIVNPKRNKG